jgi:hypothetical protein
MTILEPGPAPRARRRVVTPRDFIKQLQTRYPTESAAQIRERYKQQIRDNVLFDDRATEALAMGPLDEWLAVNVSGTGILPPASASASSPRARREATPQDRKEAAQVKETLVAEIVHEHTAVVEAEVSIRLLEYQTTYGKPLADCTGAECRRLSVRYGGFFAELAKRLRPADHVGVHLTEVELQAIARSHRLIGPKADR